MTTVKKLTNARGRPALYPNVSPIFKEGQGVNIAAERRRWIRERPEVLRRSIRCLAGNVLEQRLDGHRCTQRVEEIHHRRRTGRGGQYRLPANHLPVCSACHRACHANPELSRELGLLVMEGDPEWDLLGYAVPPRSRPLHPSTYPDGVA